MPKSGVRGMRAMRGKWQYRFRANGQDFCKITDLEATRRNLAAAVRQMEEHKQDVLLGSPVQEDLPFSDAADRFIAWSKREHADKPNTWRRQRVSMSSLKISFKGRLIGAITAGQVEDYKTWRRECGIKEVTIRHDLHNASQMFQYARKQGWMIGDPLDGVVIPSDQDSRNEYVLSAEEEKLYLDHAGTRPSLHDFAVLSLEQGMRPEEILSLLRSDVELDAGTLQVRKGKSKAAKRTIYLTDESKRILARRMGSKSDWVFPSIRRKGRRLTYSGLIGLHNLVLEETKLSFTPYSLRHTFATRLYERTKDVAAVASILGHANLRTIMRYVHVQDNHAKSAMALFEANKGQTAGVVQ